MLGMPRYLVVRESLREEIQARLKPGQKLPTEPELIKRFGVSRITVRHALEQLRSEGLITRVQGKGTFAAYPTIHPDLRAVRSFTEDIKAAGQTPSTRVINIRSVPAPARAAERLAVAPETRLVLVEKVRLADDVPISFEVSYIPEQIAAGWTAKLIEQRPIFNLITEMHGIALSRGKLDVSAGAAPQRIARALRVKTGSPVLKVERVTYTDQDRAIDYDVLYLRPDRVQYTFETSRRGQRGQAQESAVRFFVDGVKRVVTPA